MHDNTLTISSDVGRNLFTVLVKAKNKRSVPVGPTLDRCQATHLKTVLDDAWTKRVEKNTPDFRHRQIGEVKSDSTSAATVAVIGSSVFLSTFGAKHAPKSFHIQDHRVLKTITAALSFD